LSFPTLEHSQAAQESGDYWFAMTGFYSFPSFRLAQTGIESANGTKVSGQNNYWGVKANKAQVETGQFKVCKTREVIKGKSVYIYDKFASYPSLKDGYISQAKLLVTSKLYEKSRHDNNPKQYAIDVGHVYATDPNYAKVIIHYMEVNNLYQFDRMSLDQQNKALRPPVIDEKKVRNTTASAVVVATGTASTAGVTHTVNWPLVGVGAFIATLLVSLAIWQHVRAKKILANILTPPTEAEKAAVLANAAGGRIEPVGSPITIEAA
jgi:hypothetical protein